MTAEHAPVTLRAKIHPTSAVDAAAIAHAKCEAFFDDQPYQITVLEISTLSTLGGRFVAYEGHVEAVASNAEGTAEGAAA